MSFTNLTDFLESVAGQGNYQQIICYPLHNTKQPKSYSCHELLEAAQRGSWALRCRQEEFHQGRVVLIHFDTHWENIVWFWAVVLTGCIPAMSTTLSNDPAARVSHLEHLATTLKQPGCLTTAAKLFEFGGQDRITPVAVESLDVEKAPAAELRNVYRDAAPSDIAILMLTSGSTSHSKAVILTHSQVFTALATKYKVVPLPEKTSFLNWVRCDHVAALVEIHLQALFARKDQVHVQASDLLSNPLAFLDIIHRHRVSRTFAPNFFLARIRAALEGHGDACVAHQWDLSCLTYLASGGEANVTKTGAAVAKLLARYGAPATVIATGFGMTETCGGAIYNLDFPRYDIEQGLEFASAGKCISSLRMRITTNTDHAIAPAGTVGNLELSGQILFEGYFNNPQANEQSFTRDGWFKTGDLASIDGQGNLHLMGRAKESMIVNGVKYSPHEVESALDEPGKIQGLVPSFTCCFSSLPPGGDTEVICIVYLPTYDPNDVVARATAADAIAKTVMMLTGTRPHVLPLDQSQLQKSALGKLSRPKIKAAFENGDYSTYQKINLDILKAHRAKARVNPANELERRLLSLFINSLKLPEEEMDVQSSLFDMGITSVELIKLKKHIEEELDVAQEIPIITLMANPTVRALSSALEEQQSPRTGHEYNPVVTLQSQGEKTPLWLVHPGVGEVLVFLNLAKFLVDRKVYALRARGFNEGEQPFETIEEVVRTYHAAIKRRQPQGPYAIAGYSYGTMLAFEIGKVLEKNGDDVRFLGSFNLPPHIKTRMRQLDYKECLLHLSYFLDLMTEERTRELSAELQEATKEVTLAKVMAEADQNRLLELALSPEGLTKWAGLAFALQRMAVDYDPTGSIASIDVFYCHPLAVAASSKGQWLSDHLSKWADFTRSAPRFHDVGGAHYTMIGPGHVFGFQKTLQSALDARGI
ncbi:putative NRPS-like protein biosynthetic cluster [Aspergillus niger]|nr:putative NRPS-like protein biosynthetic cluster [Aspergillus niger]GLA33735.1 putative NRPS-like protein biosynthetic cluster [Aspergillus niger]